MNSATQSSSGKSFFPGLANGIDHRLRDANMPTLRFSSGDVVVKLGVSPKDWLLVHQSVIEAAMPTLAPVFRPEWKRGDEKSMAVGGEKREVFRFGLKFVDETFFLEGEVSLS